MSISRKQEILGILLMNFAFLVLLSLVTYNSGEQPGNITIGQIDNQLGVIGVYISSFLIQYVIGYASIVFPLVLFVWGWNIFRGKPLAKWTGILLLIAIYTSITLGLPEVSPGNHANPDFSKCGLLGGVIAQFFTNYLGVWGSIFLLLSLFMITIVGVTNFSFANGFAALFHEISSSIEYTKLKFETWREKRRKRIKSLLAKREATRKRGKVEEKEDEEITWDKVVKPQVNLNRSEDSRPSVQPPEDQVAFEFENNDSEEGELEGQENATGHQPPPERGVYAFPPVDLLAHPLGEEEEISEDELIRNGQILEERLQEFGVESKVIEINPGPVITRYELEPAPGVKVSRITALSDDLALAMRAKSIRIVAPIPGKGAIGIEIPNRTPTTVSLREVIDSSAFRNSESPLTLALGQTISGEPYVARLDQMPHLLIAGSTGSGKSVCLNSIIASILYKAHPTEVNFVMIDPKRLELSIYSNLRHHHLTYREDLNEEVVTKAANAVSVLKGIEAMMDDRYEILARAGVRNIADYNRKLRNGQLPELEDEDPFEPLPYIVVIVDELADLMLTAAREVEEPIARLTQMSRAVGIHLILATQRPSVDVITGIIKANFPARVAFQVASKTDSRTILDANGAEKLLGRGDMLFLPPSSPVPIRLHGTFISSEEIERIIGHIRKQARYPKQLLPIGQEEATASLDNGMLGGQRDALFNEALKLVVRHQQGSISLLQRRLKIGYARAARIIDELEAAGVVGAFDGSKAREVLIGEDEIDEILPYI